MDGFFGIGLPELFMIAIIALIVLGPERLPGTIREVAKFIKQVRSIGGDLMSQFGDEFKDLQDLDPRRILSEMTDPTKPDPPKKSPVTKTTTPTPAKNTTPASTASATKPATASANTTAEKPATVSTVASTSSTALAVASTTSSNGETKKEPNSNGAVKEATLSTEAETSKLNTPTGNTPTGNASTGNASTVTEENTIAPPQPKPLANVVAVEHKTEPKVESPPTKKRAAKKPPVEAVPTNQSVNATTAQTADAETPEAKPKAKRVRKPKAKAEVVETESAGEESAS